MYDNLIICFSNTNIELNADESDSPTEIYDADTSPTEQSNDFVTPRRSGPYNTRSRITNVDEFSRDTPSTSLLDDNNTLELLDRKISKKPIRSRYVIKYLFMIISLLVLAIPT